MLRLRIFGPDLRSRRELLRTFRKGLGCHLVEKDQQLRNFMQNTWATFYSSLPGISQKSELKDRHYIDKTSLS